MCVEDPPVYVDMHINDLADFVFTKNVNNAEIYLQLHEVEDIKDLFFFCLDLFCKGLVLMYGSNNKVTLEDLTQEQFTDVHNKLLLTGIDVCLKTEIQPNDEHVPTMIRIEEKAGASKLDDFEFLMKTSDMLYRVHFELVSRHM